MYGKGLVVSMLFGGLLVVVLLWAYLILVLLSANEIGMQSFGLIFLPSLPIFMFVKSDLSKNATFVFTTFFWFLVGCLINLILYLNNKDKRK